MARQPAITNIKKQFDKRVESSVKLYSSVLVFVTEETWEAIQGYEALHPGQAKKIISLAFLDVVAKWEDFIENCFVRYLAGAKYINNNHPVLRIKPCESIKHSYQIATSKYRYDPLKSFLSFNNWKDIEEKAKIFFEGGKPFTLLSRLEKNRLQEAIIIRNRIAHCWVIPLQSSMNIPLDNRSLMSDN